jgi:hypothetical protein
MRPLSIGLSFLIVAFTTGTAMPQQAPKTFCKIPLSNAESSPLTVTASTDGQRWVEQTVAPKTTFCWRVKEVTVKITTTRKDNTVKAYSYVLREDNRYKFYWNASDNAWDILKITPR